VSKLNQGSGTGTSGGSRKVWTLIGGVMLAGLLIAGIWLGAVKRARPALQGSSGRDEDALASGSDGRIVSSRNPKNTAGETSTGNLAQEKKKAEEAGREQQQAALDEAKRELEAKAAEQADKERQLAAEQARLEADRASAAAAAAEAERQRAAAEQQRLAESAKEQRDSVARTSQAHRYQGPSSGEIVWRGEVRGTTLVTIQGNASDTGQVIAGALPGVLVMVQPVDGKHVGIAVSPAPSNEFRRLVLRVQGNGSVQEVVHWSVP
jgi:hypothetical protein